MSRRGSELASFPQARIKKIIKDDTPVKAIGPEAVFVVSKAIELFLAQLASGARDKTAADNRSTLTYTDVARTVSGDSHLQAFLQDIVPETTTVSEARKLQEQIVEAQK